jgi:hypothetical protein
MNIEARYAYDPRKGRAIVGKCFVCHKSVSNYRQQGFRTLSIYGDGRFIGYSHQACYERWNPTVGHCKSCGKKIRRREVYKQYYDGIYCLHCYKRKIDGERRKELERIEEIKRNADRIIKSAVIIASYNTPVVREVYLCYSIAKLVYSSWDEIYAVYQKPDKKEMIQDVCKVGRSGIKRGLTNYQTDIVWKKIEKEIPDDIKYESESVLKGGMLNISEKEISIVENALRYI